MRKRVTVAELEAKIAAKDREIERLKAERDGWQIVAVRARAFLERAERAERERAARAIKEADARSAALEVIAMGATKR